MERLAKLFVKYVSLLNKNTFHEIIDVLEESPLLYRICPDDQSLLSWMCRQLRSHEDSKQFKKKLELHARWDTFFTKCVFPDESDDIVCLFAIEFNLTKLLVELQSKCPQLCASFFNQIQQKQIC